MSKKILILTVLAFCSLCCDRQQPPPPANVPVGTGEQIPPGATNFNRLDGSWYTYEFEGNKVLVHHYMSSHQANEWDSVVIQKVQPEK